MIGVKLREEREKRRFSLAQIANDTCIREGYLTAIESGDISSLPGEFFYRSFVRQYAQYLGLDGLAIERQLDSELPPQREGEAAARLRASLEARNTGLSISPSYPRGQQFIETEGSEFGEKSAGFREPRDLRPYMAFALVLLTASGSWLVWQRMNAAVPETTVQAGTATPETQPLVTKRLPAASESRTESQPSPAPAAEMPQAGKASAQADPGKPVQLLVAATERSWLRMQADNTTSYIGVLESGEQWAVEGSTATIFTGNAGGLDVMFNGKSIGPIGPHGQVRTVVFTPDNFEIRSPVSKKTERPASKPSSPAAPPAASPD